MCRLFGLHAGTNVVTATFWLLDAPDNLSEQSRRNPDGSGLGVFDAQGRPQVHKQPIAAWEDAEFATEAHDLTGTTFVAHVRYATTGSHDVVNTHPFLQDGRIFAHNGVLEGLDVLDERLREVGTADLVLGQTDSERVFALITASIRARGGDVTAGLVDAMRWLADNVPIYAVNILLSTATDLWAMRYPESHELYLSDRREAPPDHRFHLRTSRIRADVTTSARAAVGRVRHRADGRCRTMATHRTGGIDPRRCRLADQPRSGATGSTAPSAAARGSQPGGFGVAASDRMTGKRALVLGGGGVAGIAWETGILLGIADESPAAAAALLDSDVLLGTSAGSAVVAQISSGLDLAELFARQVSETSAEIDPGVGIEAIMELFLAALSDPDTTVVQKRQRIGAVALAADTVAEPLRRNVIAQRLPSHVWPDRVLRLTAIDIATGELVVLDRDSGVDLVDAVAASCAVPGAWPPVTIGDRRYMDGGIGSTINLDVADDCGAAVVLVPAGESAPSAFGAGPAVEISGFRGTALGVFADEESLAAYGSNALDPRCRLPSAHAGRAQGRREAAAVAAFLGIA